MAIIVFLLTATVFYAWLIEHFGYDDILRAPTPHILTAFHAGGARLVLAWFGFAMSAMLFIPVALCFERMLAAHQRPAKGAMVLGIASAIVQALGLLRWVMVVPALAGAFADPAASAASREVLVVAFDVVHRYGGMVMGEMVGQLLLAGWTALACLQLHRSRAVPRWLAGAGALTVPFWLLGQTELLHMVAPAVAPFEVIPFAFMAWEAWLALLAAALLVGAWREWRRPATAALAN